MSDRLAGLCAQSAFRKRDSWLLSATVVCILAACAFLVGMRAVPVTDRDEPRFAQASRQMAEGDSLADWIVPRVGDELRAEGGAADADHEEVFEFTLGAGDGARVDPGGKVFDRNECGGDRVGQFGRGCELRRAEPVVTDHAALVRVGDGSLLERVHGGEGLPQRPFHRRQETVREIHPAEVQRQSSRRKLCVGLLKPIPKCTL